MKDIAILMQAVEDSIHALYDGLKEYEEDDSKAQTALQRAEEARKNDIAAKEAAVQKHIKDLEAQRVELQEREKTITRQLMMITSTKGEKAMAEARQQLQDIASEITLIEHMIEAAKADSIPDDPELCAAIDRAKDDAQAAFTRRRKAAREVYDRRDKIRLFLENEVKDITHRLVY